ncbi:hypothetical protein ACVBEH_10405 [Roseateles sp. GG27B]
MFLNNTVEALNTRPERIPTLGRSVGMVDLLGTDGSFAHGMSCHETKKAGLSPLKFKKSS